MEIRPLAQNASLVQVELIIEAGMTSGKTFRQILDDVKAAGLRFNGLAISDNYVIELYRNYYQWVTPGRETV